MGTLFDQQVRPWHEIDIVPELKKLVQQGFTVNQAIKIFRESLSAYAYETRYEFERLIQQPWQLQ